MSPTRESQTRQTFLRTVAEDIRSTVDPTGKSEMGIRIGMLVKLVFSEKVHAVIWFRISHVLWRKGLGPLAMFVRRRTLALYGLEIHPRARIGPGLCLVHTNGVTIGDAVTIGRNCRVHNHVLVGETGRGSRRPLQQPTIGDDVTLGAMSLSAGSITIGDGAVIGAHSYVIKDVAPHTIVVGVPARFLRETDWARA